MRMKKLLSILLITAMLASMAVTAFAEGEVTDIPAEQVPMTELAPDATAVTVEPAAATQENGSFSVREGSDYQAAYEAAGITFENGTLTINKATFEAFAAKDSEQKALMTRDGKLYVGLEFSVPSNDISQYQKFQLADTREVDLTKELDQQYGLDVYTDSSNNKHVVVYINVTKDENGTIRDPLTNKEFVGSWKGENNEVKVTSTYTLNVAIDETVLSEASITPTLGNFTLENEVYKGKLTLTNTGDKSATVAISNAKIVNGESEEVGTVTVDSSVLVPGKDTDDGVATANVTVTFTAEGAPVEGTTYNVTMTMDNVVDESKSFTAPFKIGTTNPEPPTGGDNNDNTSGGGSSSSNEDNTPANAPSANVGSNGAVSAAKISGDAKKAVSNAKNGKANVNVTNAKTVGTAALNNMAKAAAKEDVALTMTAKTTDKNGVVVASLKFDATKAAEAVAKAGTKEVKLGVELNTKNTKNVTSLFKKWFKNKNIAVVKMAQKGEFGFTVEAAVKVDLKNFNKNNLKFYSYDAATNTYKEIETKYTIDAKGLVHFNTTVGNYIIITDAPIASK